MQYSRQFDRGFETDASQFQSPVRSTTQVPASSIPSSQTMYQPSAKPDTLYNFVKLVFGVVGAIFIFSIFYYLSSSSSTDTNASACSDQAVDRWFDQSYAIFEDSDADYQLIDSIEYYSEFSPLASRAENRYLEHQRLDTPACLKKIKELSDQFLFTEWKMYQAAAQGDFDSAVDYETEVGSIGEQIAREIDLLYEGQWYSDIYFLSFNSLRNIPQAIPNWLVLVPKFHENNLRICSDVQHFSFKCWSIDDRHVDVSELPTIHQESHRHPPWVSCILRLGPEWWMSEMITL